MHEIVYFQLRYLSLLPLQPIKYALDHEGRAVGVAALWGYFINRDVADSISADICTTSAEVSKLEVRKPTINR